MLVSNQSAEKLSLVEAFEGYKQEYKVENVFRRMNNDTFQTVPMYLQRPERINAMLLLILIAVQAFTLIDRQAAQFIETSKKPICGLFPNKIRTFRPKAEQILKAFDNIQLIVLQTEGGTHHWVTTLSPLQQQLIQLLDIPPLYYQSQYIVPRLQKRIQSFVAT
jgi:transposase